MSRHSAALLVMVALAGGAAAASAAPRLTPTPAWVEVVEVGDAAHPRVRNGVEGQLLDVQLRVGPGLRERHIRTVERLVSAEGLDQVSPIVLEFDPIYEELLVHHVSVRRGGQVIDGFASADVKLLDVEEDLSRRLFDGRRQMVIVVRDLRVGDVLDVAFTIAGKNPVFGAHTVGGLTLGTPAFGRVRARVRSEPGGAPALVHVRGEAPPPVRREQGGVTEVAWDITDGPVVDEEDRLPDWFEAFPQVEVTDFRSWGEVVSWALPLYPPVAPSPALAELIAAWRKQPPAEGALAALRFVQDDIRYLGFELGPESHAPHPPERVLAQRFGDCKDKSYLLATALQAMGIEARVALVNTERRGRIMASAPTPLAFDHVIVRAEIGGKVYWLDPTWSYQGGTLATQASPPFERALVVRAGTSELDTIPAVDPGAPFMEVEERYRVAANGTATLEVRTIHRQASADAARDEWSRDPPEDLGRRYLNFYAQRQASIKQARLPRVNDDRLRNEIIVEESYEIPTFWSKAGQADLRAHALDELLRAPRVRQRKLPLALAYPARTEHRIDVELPEDYDIEPLDETIERGGLRFHGHVAWDRPVLSMRFSLATTVADVMPAGVAAHLQALDDVEEALEETLTKGSAVPLERAKGGGTVTLILGLLGLAIGGLLVARVPRLLRRRAFRRSVARTRGEQPSTAIDIDPGSALHLAGGKTRCACGGRRAGVPEQAAAETVWFDGAPLLAARFTCQKCRATQALYFREMKR